MKIWESSFEDLNVDHRGAGFALSNKCNLSLRFDKFVRCRTTANEGGGFYADVKKISISCVIFIECYSPDEGSAFHITSQCESSKIQESTIARSRGFEQDGFISYGRIENGVHNSNVSECSGRDSALTNWPKSEATSRYFFMNIFEVSTTSQGIFWTYSKVRIEDSNIIRCQTTHLVGIQYGSGATLSFCRNVIIDGKFDQFYSSPLTEKDSDTGMFWKTSFRFTTSRNSGIWRCNIFTRIIYCGNHNLNQNSSQLEGKSLKTKVYFQSVRF